MEYEATFCLDGQPYVFEHEALRTMGPETAVRAFFETKRYFFVLWASRLLRQPPPGEARPMSEEEYMKRSGELLMGAVALTDMVGVANVRWTQSYLNNH